MMGILMMGSFMVVVFNLVADLAYGWLDPRIVYS
jgi:ABC-type dipeptide/oligopeptide/nickel transport system permease component